MLFRSWSPTGSALAYITYDRTNADMPGGLFLAEAPGKPARLLVGGAFFPAVCCGQQPFIWASNDTMLIAQLGDNTHAVRITVCSRIPAETYLQFV